jgi:hypothetical protein
MPDHLGRSLSVSMILKVVEAQVLIDVNRGFEYRIESKGISRMADFAHLKQHI